MQGRVEVRALGADPLEARQGQSQLWDPAPSLGLAQVGGLGSKLSGGFE